VVIGLSANPTWMLVVAPLHGITFGVWYLSGVKFVQTQAPEALRASVQGIAHAAIGVGTVLGYLVAGQVFDRFGGGASFLAAAVAAMLAGLVYLQARAAAPAVSG
jgi:MFS family permease